LFFATFKKQPKRDGSPAPLFRFPRFIPTRRSFRLGAFRAVAFPFRFYKGLF